MMKAIIYYSEIEIDNPHADHCGLNSEGGRRQTLELKTVIFTDKIIAIREAPRQILIDTVDDLYGIDVSDQTHIMDKITEFILSDTTPNILEINKPEKNNESSLDNDLLFKWITMD